MADSIKETFNPNDLHTKVLFQRGKNVLPFELNEAQEILRVGLAKTVLNGVQGVLGSLNPGSNDDGYKVTGTGAANSVTIGGGYIFCDGIAIFAPGGTLSSFTTNVGPSDRTDVVYLAVTEQEVSDPNQIIQIGETTKRRKLAVTLNVSTTGLPGVPSNTPQDIVNGGVHYFPIASIVRPSGQAVINSNEVTDLRKLLPPGLLEQGTIQIDRKLDSFVFSKATTPDGTKGVPKSNSMQFFIDPTSGPKVELFRIEHRPDWQLGETSPSESSVWGRLHLGEGYILSAEHTLKFGDANLGDASGVPYTVRFSSGLSTTGANKLRVLSADSHVEVPDYSMLQSLNGRYGCTLGDGVNTFGDFNGANALQDALSFFHYSFGPGPALTAKDVTIYLKTGSYDLSNFTPSGIGFWGTLTLVGGGPSTVINLGANVSIDQSDNQVRFENLTLQSQVAGRVLATTLGGQCFFDSCVVNNVILRSSFAQTNYNTKRTSFTLEKTRVTYSWVTGSPFDLAPVYTSFPPSNSPTVAFLLQDCVVLMGQGTRPVFSSAAVGSLVRGYTGGVDLRNSSFDIWAVGLGTAPSYGDNPSYPTGLFDFSTAVTGIGTSPGNHIENVLIDNCTISAQFNNAFVHHALGFIQLGKLGQAATATSSESTVRVGIFRTHRLTLVHNHASAVGDLYGTPLYVDNTIDVSMDETTINRRDQTGVVAYTPPNMRVRAWRWQFASRSVTPVADEATYESEASYFSVYSQYRISGVRYPSGTAPLFAGGEVTLSPGYWTGKALFENANLPGYFNNTPPTDLSETGVRAPLRILPAQLAPGSTPSATHTARYRRNAPPIVVRDVSIVNSYYRAIGLVAHMIVQQAGRGILLERVTMRHQGNTPPTNVGDPGANFYRGLRILGADDVLSGNEVRARECVISCSPDVVAIDLANTGSFQLDFERCYVVGRFFYDSGATKTLSSCRFSDCNWYTESAIAFNVQTYDNLAGESAMWMHVILTNNHFVLGAGSVVTFPAIKLAGTGAMFGDIRGNMTRSSSGSLGRIQASPALPAAAVFQLRGLTTVDKSANSGHTNAFECIYNFASLITP